MMARGVHSARAEPARGCLKGELKTGPLSQGLAAEGGGVTSGPVFRWRG